MSLMADFNPLSLLQGIGALMSNLPGILAIIDNIFYFALCMSLGSLAMKGWKRERNWSLTVIGSIILGLTCLAGGVLLSQVITLQLPFLNGILQALITAVIIYLVLALLSSENKIITNLVTSEEFLKLKSSFESLKNQFDNLKKILEKKKIMPDKLDIKELQKNLKDFLEKKEIKEYEIKNKEEQADFITFLIKDKKKNEYRIGFDSYTGENLSFIQLGKKIPGLLTKPKPVIGLVIAIIFGIYLTTLLNESSMSELNKRLSLTGLSLITDSFSNYEINNTDCYTLNDLMYLIKTRNLTVNHGINATSTISNRVKQAYPQDELLPGLSLSINSTNYYVSVSSIMNESSMNKALENYLQQNMLSVIQGSIDFCGIKHENQEFKDIIHLCSTREGRVCECKNLGNATGYCTYFSSIISEQITSELGIDASQLSNLLGMLGSMK